MAYRGPRVICDSCRGSFSRPADLRRHLDKGRCPGRALPGKRQHRPIRAEVIEVRPIRSEIVLATRPACLARPIPAANREIMRAAPAQVQKSLEDEKLAEARRLERT
jgi:hypothetical protein